MTYAATLNYLLGLQKHGIKLGLHAVERLLARAGHPHRRYPSLHIGGTNGKGSTAAMAASIFRAAGYRVGLYTSPHLVDFRERIRVNGEPIAAEAVIELTHRLRRVAAKSIDPTFFEFTTAMAFTYFADMDVELAVIEVGMGGRFDATNVLTPLVSCITNVSLDHQAHLGRTVPAIAFEKAGIIKSGVPVVLGNLTPDARQVIADVAAAQGAPCFFWQESFRAEGDPVRGFRYAGLKRLDSGLRCPLAGIHQLENAGCAAALTELVMERGFHVSEAAIRLGFERVAWEGRLEVVDRDPLVLLDGAHNPAAASVLAEYLHAFRRQHAGRIVLVVGLMRDKDRQGFLHALLACVDEVIVTQLPMARAATVHEIRDSMHGWPGSTHCAMTSGEALARARSVASPRDLILVTGSLMLVGEVKALLRGCEVSLLRG